MEKRDGGEDNRTDAGDNTPGTGEPGDSTRPPQEASVTEHDIQQGKRLSRYYFFDRAQTVIRWLDSHNGLLTAVATLAIAALTYFLATDSAQQARISEHQLTVMQSQLNEMQIDNRAWISPSGAYVIPPFVNGKGIKVSVSLINSGRLPAAD